MTQIDRSVLWANTLLWAAFPLSVLNEIGYRLHDVEMYLVIGLFGAIGFVTAATRSRIVLAVSSVVLAVLYFDTYLDLTPWLAVFLLHVIAVFAACMFFVPRQTTQIVAAFALIFGLTSFLSPQPVGFVTTGSHEGVSAQSDKKLVYVILDEKSSPFYGDTTVEHHISPDEMAAYYVSRGATLFARARSLSSNTLGSVTSVLSLDSLPRNYRKNDKADYFGNSIVNNALLTELEQRGFQQTYVQSTHLGFCTPSERVVCLNYNGLGNVQAFGDQSLSMRSAISLRVFIDYLEFKKLGYLKRAREQILPKTSGSMDDAPRMPLMVDFLQGLPEAVADMQPGSALVAHIIIPHFPYIYDEECRLLPVSQWRSVKYRTTPYAPDEVEELFNGHWRQARCVDRLMAPLFEQVAKQDDTTLIVHGDHGSRIYRYTKAADAEATKDDTLFTTLAVHRPGEEAEAVMTEIPLQDTVGAILKAFLQSADETR
ncbi:sulfatase-like hydrolase/transferase [Oceanomicrobium pacificus]|uniref:Sulfatase N-terminal domain-containing protein n=1 Tax=Oceanomicrobium pacificus TaxID=2692916 RepID=A0A6B0TXK7_9RHOB|nr:sulfatase-like hydrolase/transferase [Oceanomicrobium pacificus]MXU66435.1 hypothetical protein [Oceanomicrobium pacificus]